MNSQYTKTSPQSKILFERQQFLLSLIAQYSYSSVSYKKLASDLRRLAAAKYTVIQLLSPDKKNLETVAFSGINSNLKKVMALQGLDLGSESYKLDSWSRKIITRKKVRKLNVLKTLNAFWQKPVTERIQTTLGFGEIHAVGIGGKNGPTGALFVLLEDGKELEFPEIIELFANQILPQIKLSRQMEIERNFLRLISENSSDRMILVDSGGKIKYINKSLTNNKKRAIIDENILNFFPLNQQSSFVKLFKKVFREMRPYQSEMTFNFAHDSELLFNIKLIPTLIESEKYLYITLRDVTKERSIQQHLQAGNRRLALIENFMDYASDAVQVADEKGRLVYLNKTARERLGITAQDINSYQVSDFELLFQKEGSWRKHFLELKKRKMIVAEGINRNLMTGRQFPVEVTVRYAKINNREYVVANSRVITDNIMKNSLHKKRQEFTSLYHALENSAIVSVSDTQGIITQVNQLFCEISGYQEIELLGQNHRILNSGYHTKAFWRKMWKKISSGQTFRAEICNRAKDGSLYWIDNVFNPIFDEDKNITHYLSIQQDITEKKQKELQINRLNEFRKLLAEISAEFIKADHLSINMIIQMCLAKMGLFFEIERVFLFQIDDSGSTITNTHDWHDESVPSFKFRIQNTNIRKFPWFARKIYKQELFSLADVNSLPKFARAEKEEWLEQKIQSILFVRLNIQERAAGVLGFATHSPRGEWSEDLLAGLRVIANIIADALFKSKLEKETLEAREKADFANRAKSVFLANMSHEIRTPLNSIIGFTELLLSSKLETDHEQMIKNTNSSAHLLLELVNDLLDYSKIEAGKLDITEVQTNIIHLAEQVIDILKYSAVKKDIELILNIPPGFPQMLMIDPVRIKQVLINLIGNAIKFTDKGEVELCLSYTLDKRGNLGEFLFRIRDTGIGITADQQSKIFEAFSQADNSITRKYGGTGLGLAISRSLIERMGSSLRLTSVVGFGSIFYFNLTREFERTEVDTANAIVDLNRILVLFATETYQKICVQHLEYWGVQPVIAGSVDEALAALSLNADFKVLILDEKLLFEVQDFFISKLAGISTTREIKLLILRDNFQNNDYSQMQNFPNLKILYLIRPLKMNQLFGLLLNLRSMPEVPPVAIPVGDSNLLQSNLQSDNPVILIAEDIEINVMLLRKILERLIPSCRILIAENGAKAIQLFFQHQPNIVFMDVQMPVLDGINATMNIRSLANPLQLKVPIIALSAGVSAEDRAHCLTAGMDEFLGKPFRMQDIQGLLEKFGLLK